MCTENLIRIDCVTESPNVNGDDRAEIVEHVIGKRIGGAVLGHSAFAWLSTVSNVGQTMRLLRSVLRG